MFRQKHFRFPYYNHGHWGQRISDGHIGQMAFTGGGQTAEQSHLVGGRRGGLFAEKGGGLRRPHGVRARWPAPNLENMTDTFHYLN